MHKNFMKKNLSLIIIFYLSLITLSYGAASSGGNDAVSSSSNYDKGAYLIKKAKKLENKGYTLLIFAIFACFYADFFSALLLIHFSFFK